MDKSKKRAINKYKYDRVHMMEFEPDCWDNSIWYTDGNIVCHDNFLYWKEYRGAEKRYFRKSVKEALS